MHLALLCLPFHPTENLMQLLEITGSFQFVSSSGACQCHRVLLDVESLVALHPELSQWKVYFLVTLLSPLGRGLDPFQQG